MVDENREKATSKREECNNEGMSSNNRKKGCGDLLSSPFKRMIFPWGKGPAPQGMECGLSVHQTRHVAEFFFQQTGVLICEFKPT